MSSNHFLKVVVIFLCFLVVTGFVNDTIQKKIIRTKEYDIHLFVSLKEKKTAQDKMYFWFKSGEVHNSFGDAGGPLLHNEYIKYYRGNTLAEKGMLKYGLKIGAWKRWYENGQLKEVVNYSNGQKSGKYYAYNNQGALITSGNYSKETRDGTWIDYVKKDTMWHKKGKAYPENPRVLKKRQDSIDGKQSFLKRIFKKKNSLKLKKKKPSLFKRLFSKKKKD